MSISTLLIILFLIGNTLLLSILLINQKKQARERLQFIQLLEIEQERFNKEKNIQLIEEQRTHVLLLALRIREAISKQTEDIHARIIEETPLEHGLNKEEIARCFTTKQALAVEHLFLLYRDYVHAYWLTDQKQPKKIFRGTKYDHRSELFELHAASRELVNRIDHLLVKIQKQL